ncbi:hypothetical protein BH09ACT4_BH09ACT4_18660 [soil metagenome]
MTRLSSAVVRGFGIAVATPLLLTACTAGPLESPNPQTAPDASTHDACLLGTWKSGPGEGASFIHQLAADQFAAFGDVAPDGIDGDGWMVVTFADDGTFLYQPDLSFSIDFPKGGPLPGTLTGQTSGTWTTQDGDTLFANADSADVTVSVEMNGRTRVGDPWGWTELPLIVSRYTCGEGALSLDVILSSTKYTMDFVPAS